MSNALVLSEDLDFGLDDYVIDTTDNPQADAHHLHAVYEIALGMWGAAHAQELVEALVTDVDATSIPAVSVNLLPPTTEELFEAYETPRDPRTRLSLGERTRQSIEGHFHRATGEAKNHGHRTAPMKKRGDTAKKQRRERDHKLAAAMHIERQRLHDQLSEVSSHLLVRTRFAPELI